MSFTATVLEPAGRSTNHTNGQVNRHASILARYNIIGTRRQGDGHSLNRLIRDRNAKFIPPY